MRLLISNSKFAINHGKLGFVLKHKNLFRPLIKIYGKIAFTLTYTKRGTRVNKRKEPLTLS